MSYITPFIPAPGTLISIDAAIESIRASLEVIDWLTTSFGRAYTFTETIDGRKQSIPKCYTSLGEYHNVLPSDFQKAQSFIVVNGSEKFTNYNAHMASTKETTLGLIVWGNLKKINASKDYIFTQELMKDVVDILKPNKYVSAIEETIDEDVKRIFEGYDLAENEYLMYPYAGFRINFVINYDEAC